MICGISGVLKKTGKKNCAAVFAAGSCTAAFVQNTM